MDQAGELVLLMNGERGEKKKSYNADFRKLRPLSLTLTLVLVNFCVLPDPRRINIYSDISF